AGRDAARRTPAVVRPAPVVQDDRVGVGGVPEVADDLLLGRAATEVLDGRVDEPDADAVLRARPTVGGNLVLDGVVAVLVLDRALVNPLREYPLLLGVDDHTRAPVLRGALEHVAVG